MKVRIYVEGGPKSTRADGLRRFRNGFKQHFLKLDPRLGSLDVSPCGSTIDAIRDYKRAVREDDRNCILALLVDSDTPVSAATPAKHLQLKLDSAKIPANARENVFLMVQCMESWLVSDSTALGECFGQNLRATVLPQNPDIEMVSREDVIAALKSAIKPTPTGRYQKAEHGAKILAKLNPKTVGDRSRHAKSLHRFLRDSLKP